ncbi:MAG: hypothetical protein JWS10_921 [Cypionkella sp.]|uniref:phage tail protein n=1 Tax=Cypionkella sp. TaxID=2811411 RepID=UPI002620DE04|nr:phage tail protein [Cypionkella sp.]MDB5658306.1 hypothetical protein [Cypionkella sp.]
MRYFLTLFWALFAYILTVSEASAGPVFVALMASGASFGAAFSATALGTFMSTIAGRLLTSIALTALQRATMAKPKPAGITTSQTATGGTNPAGFILGKYATAGDAVCPPMSHGKVSKTPNAYLTYVIAVGDIPGQTLDRVGIDGAWVDISATTHPDYGKELTGVHANHAWVKYYDGTQTVADPMLLAKYGSYPERPWLADMVGTGVAYVIFTFRYDRKVYTEFPDVLIESGGIKLYDPRKDTTIGGSGAHRWGQPATYQSTVNPIVMAYNINRGITIAGLGVWGGAIEQVDLPNASWFSGMNTCDITAGSPAAAQYRAGYEVRVDMEPAAVVEELFKGCAGEIAEVGGEFKVRVGGPGLPVMFVTDDDIVVSKAQDFDPFPQADGRRNGIDAKYPDPAVMWAPKSAPSRYNTTWEAEDGERRVVALDMPACPFPDQVQRIMLAYIADERRFRRHNMTLAPDAAILEPLDVISWTSARNSYTAKLFDLSQLTDDLNTALQRVSVREVDAADFVFTGALISAPTPSPNPVIPPAQTLASWDVQPLPVTDGAGVPRKPGIVMTWSATDMDAVEAVQYQVRVKDTGAIVKIGTVSDVDGGRIPLTEGIVLGVTYQAQGLPVAPGRSTAWTAWVDVTAPLIGIGPSDLSAALAAQIAETVAVAAAAQAKLDQLTAGLLTGVNGALAAIEARTKGTLKGWLLDPIFARWSAGNLVAANWISRAGLTVYGTQIAGEYGAGVSVDVPTGTGVVNWVARSDAGMQSANPQSPYVVMTAVLEVIAADLPNSYLRPEWSPDGSTWTRGEMVGIAAAAGSFAQLGITQSPGVKQAVEVLVKRPAGTFTYVRLVGYPKQSSSTIAHKSIWHLFQVREASQADIDAGKVYAVAGPTPGSSVAVQGIGAALAAVSTGLSAQVGDIDAEITDIKAVSVSALTGTALGTLLTQLGVSAGGLSSFVTVQGAAVADLEGNAAASYVLRVGAGGASAGVELVAADDPISGPASILTFSAKHIELLASSLRISDSGNAYPDYNMLDENFYSSTTGAVMAFIGTGPTTQKIGQFYGGISANAATMIVYSNWFPVEPATEYLVSAGAWLAASLAGAGTCTVNIQTGELSADGSVAQLTNDQVMAKTDLSYQNLTNSISLTTAGTAKMARFRIIRSAGGAQGARFGGFKMQKKAPGILIGNGQISGLVHIDTGTLRADDIQTGLMNARFLEVTELFTITDSGALSVGKESAFDFDHDGIFFGKTLGDGGFGFGFHAGKKIGGRDQYIQVTDQTGLKVVNAKHFVTGATIPVVVTRTSTTAKTNLPAASSTLSIDLIGGGAEGCWGATAGSAFTTGAGNAGGVTTVKVYDGATLKKTYTSAGGVNTGSSSYKGEASALAAGGDAAIGGGAGGAGSLGSGGGGGSASYQTNGGSDSGDNVSTKYYFAKGGKAAKLVSIANLDISGYAAPAIEITIGNGGDGAGNGGAGGKGRVVYSYSADKDIAADVVPMTPTNTGTMSKVGLVVTFPNLGAGFWVLQEDAGTDNLDIGLVDIGGGVSIMIRSQCGVASFFAAKTPVRLSGGFSANRTIRYAFHSMGKWGD